jgi:hypothetical protein
VEKMGGFMGIELLKQAKDGLIIMETIELDQ